MSKKNNSGLLIKSVITIGIIMVGALINVGLSEAGSGSPIVVIIAGFAILAVWAWKPGQSSDISEIDVKPLDKTDDDREV